MRTIECNECGEPITAADDQELARNLTAHLGREHDAEPEPEEVAELIAAEAYDAMDS
jgi:predicted small metal-binding protein